MKRSFCILLVSLFSLGVWAQRFQEYPDTDTHTVSGDSVPQKRILNIRQDPRIDDLLNLHKQQNRWKNTMKGFRLQIFATSGTGAREEAESVKARFLSEYMDYGVYVTFQSPDWKVRVGDFRNKSEALKLKEEVKRMFPNAFIVPDDINFPKL